MATNLSLACDAVASDTCEVAQVLSDIPFISVGILVFGVSVLFFVLKRVPLSAIFLFFSAMLAFIAAILDTSQFFADGSAINTASVSSKIIQAREVLLALSSGFRFLFYWSYVAEISRRDLSAQGVWKIDLPIFESIQEPHSGTRYPQPGKLAAAGLLVAIITVTALQIVWRVVPQFRQYSNIYATDAVLDLLVSFLILLKYLSNATTLRSVDTILVHTISSYLIPIFGLSLNIAIGVGNLLRFAFTETMVGRLLQAVEVFIITVSVMLTAVLERRNFFLSTISSQDTNHGDVVFTLPEPVRGSTFRITPPLIETPRMSTVLDVATQTKESRRELLPRPTRRSLNVSSWLSFRISRRHSHHEDDEVKLWSAEKVKGDSTNTGEVLESSTQASREWHRRVHDASANHMTTTLDAQSIIARSTDSRNGRTLRAHQLHIPQRTTSRTSPARFSPVLLPTAEAKRTENVTIGPEASPVYGLSGVQSLASDYGSQTSLDDLMRQQNELDKSIEALRSSSAERSNAVPNHRSAVQLARSPSTGQKTVCSEVSLSNFPIPPGPTVPIPSLPSSRSSPIQRIRGDRRILLAAARGQDAHALAPLRTLATLAGIPNSPCINSVPYSPTGEENESLSGEAEAFSRSNAEGMQYNVTSFIGDLATPGGSRRDQEMPYWRTENEPNFGTGLATLPRQPDKLLAKPSRTHSSGLSQGDVYDEHAGIMYQAAGALTIPRVTVTDDAEKGVSPILISQPVRDTRTVPGGDKRVPKMFVRRRPARLAINTYNPGIPQVEPVQVLDDS